MIKKGITIKSTDNINNEENITLLKQICPDCIVVVGTRKLKKEVFTSARIGAINLHSGILPFYRGADSEFWALYHNEPHMVGVTIHFIEEGLDSGDIILRENLRVKPDDDHRRLRMKNIRLGARKINEAVSLIEAGSYERLKQGSPEVKTFTSAKPEEIRKLKERKIHWQSRSSVIKSFGNSLISAEEEVAEKPLVEFTQGLEISYPRIFCLRIDADEFNRNNFHNYLQLFRKYRNAVTLFVNANSFTPAREELLECKGMGLDIQSHGFYHHIYNDYESNLYNISKAKSFFDDLGIDTRGFAAPMGRWNRNLMLALEELGYEYSSDFSYDYLGLPSYPSLGKSISKILEVPIFPVACELFFQKSSYNLKEVIEYFKGAIDQMDACGIPVIVYAHTSDFKDTSILLDEITDYALSKKGLLAMNMSTFVKNWKEKVPMGQKRRIRTPAPEFLGEKIYIGLNRSIKNSLKRHLDFERITPLQDLQCSQPGKAIKKFLRKVL